MTEVTIHRIVDTEHAELIGELRNQQHQLRASLPALVELLQSAGLLDEGISGDHPPIQAMAEAAESLGVLAERLAETDSSTETILRAEHGQGER